MVSATHTAHDIEITAESLQEDLARLRIQKQALERELAAVVAHLGSVQRALGALRAVMLETGGRPASTDTAGAGDAEPGVTAAPVEPQPGMSSSDSADVAATTAPKGRRQERRPGAQEPASPAKGAGDSPTADSQADTDGHMKYGKLTEQILEHFAGVGDVDVRARDVAAALGRDTDSGSINAVRSTLDRLVGTSRIRRTGRGLYRAKKS
ncbi:hypothetical protein [Streptomyces sp. NPDC001315]|uniref:hypothetical protein n=1 Tax=Streptomyces sp. NPDC001315 TaxID=3364562 RepID=UPI0036946612